MSRKEEILNSANAAQQSIIKSVYGKYVADAAPGSGKTRTVVLRTAYMIECGIPADQILMFTFTRKAAEEMRTRVTKYIGSKAKGLTICTCHSFCGKLLRHYANIVGLQPTFTIYDENDSLQAIANVITDNKVLLPDYQKNVNVREVKAEISKFRDNIILPSVALRNAVNPVMKQLAIIYQKYDEYLKKSNVLDFDSLIYFAVLALQQSAVMREQVNAQYRYIIQDEAQDQGRAEAVLVPLLAGPDEKSWNLMYVCDSDQSIFGFRGADVNDFVSFVRNHDFTYLHMGQNYRSTQTIVKAAESVVKKNKNRVSKELFTENKQGAPVQVITVEDETREATVIGQIINKIVVKGYKYSDIAILYRFRGQANVLDTAFKKMRIPHKIVSGESLFAARVVKDILAYIRLVVNPRDREAFRRIVNVPARGVGDASLKAILDYFQDNEGVTIFESCKAAKVKQTKTKQGIDNFVNIILQLCDIAAMIESTEDDPDISVATLISETYNLINYDEYIRKNIADNYEQSKSLLQALSNVAKDYKNVTEFINMTADIKEEDEDENDTVKLMTLHVSKGLEWPVVIIVGNNDGCLPSFKSLQEGNLEEERRLFYVGMTRAKDVLFLTRSKSVMRGGKPSRSLPSRFLKEIDNVYVKTLKGGSGV